MSGTQTLGTRKTLSYHERGRTPRNTHWTIHEYQATGNVCMIYPFLPPSLFFFLINTVLFFRFFHPKDVHTQRRHYYLTGNLCCFVFQIVQDKYVLCHLINKSDENTGCHIPVPVKAVAGRFSPAELPIIQENSPYGHGILKILLQVLEMASPATFPGVLGRAPFAAILKRIICN